MKTDLSNEYFGEKLFFCFIQKIYKQLISCINIWQTSDDE